VTITGDTPGPERREEPWTACLPPSRPGQARALPARGRTCPSTARRWHRR